MFDLNQIETIERIQKDATKIILGSPWYKSQEGYLCYQERLDKLRLESLTTRVRRQTVKFAKKAETSQHFAPLLHPRNPTHGMPLRSRRIYDLPIARTERTWRSPVLEVIRILNGIVA